MRALEKNTQLYNFLFLLFCLPINSFFNYKVISIILYNNDNYYKYFKFKNFFNVSFVLYKYFFCFKKTDFINRKGFYFDLILLQFFLLYLWYRDKTNFRKWFSLKLHIKKRWWYIFKIFEYLGLKYLCKLFYKFKIHNKKQLRIYPFVKFFEKRIKFSKKNLFKIQKLIKHFLKFLKYIYNNRFKKFKFLLFLHNILYEIEFLLNKFNFLKKQRAVLKLNIIKINKIYNERKYNFSRKIKNLVIKNNKFFLYEYSYFLLQTFYLFFILSFNKIKPLFLKLKIDFKKLNFQYIFLKNLNLFYKNFYYNCIMKKTRSNWFITIINRVGEVIISYSTGKIFFLKKRKKRKAADSLNFLIKVVADLLRKKKIFILRKLLINISIFYLNKKIYFLFLKNGIRIKYLNYIKKRPHGKTIRAKKLRRL